MGTLGLISSTLYGLLCAFVVLLVAAEGDNSMVRAFALLGPPFIGALAYLAALIQGDGPHGRAWRLTGWFLMALGLYGLISFSFIVVPLLALAAPAAFATAARSRTT